jgi:hypothetical protein
LVTSPQFRVVVRDDRVRQLRFEKDKSDDANQEYLIRNHTCNDKLNLSFRTTFKMGRYPNALRPMCYVHDLQPCKKLKGLFSKKDTAIKCPKCNKTCRFSF